MTSLERLVSDLEKFARTVAVHFCEDPNKFKLSDCFSIFTDLIDNIETARKDNAMRKKQEERMLRLAAEKAMQSNLIREQGGANSRKLTSLVAQERDVCIVDQLLADIRRGEFKLKKSCRGE